MLARRLVSAACLIGVTLLFVFADATRLGGVPAGLWMLPIYLFLACGTAYEFASLLKSQADIDPLRLTLLVAGAALVGAIPILYPLLMSRPYPVDCPIGIVGWGAIAVAVAVTLLLIGSLRQYARSQISVAISLAAAVLVACYCLTFGHFLICIRLSPPDRTGLLLLIGIVFVTKMSDAGAYFLGRAFGRRALHLIISPKKTVEGAVGGALVAILAAFAYFQFMLPAIEGRDPPTLSAWRAVTLAFAAAVIAAVALVGDLSESLIKRSCNAKDSGRLLPGLGGVWDVTDSLFFIAPIAYLFVVADWIG